MTSSIEENLKEPLIGNKLAGNLGGNLALDIIKKKELDFEKASVSEVFKSFEFKI